MGGIDPFGDIMGTSAGPAREEENDLFMQAAHAKVNSHLHPSINSRHAGTNTATHTEGQASVKHPLFQRIHLHVYIRGSSQGFYYKGLSE